jgi:hypothetical protein
MPSWGIKIEPKYPVHFRLSDTPSMAPKLAIGFVFSFGLGNSGNRLFFTTPALQKLIMENPACQGCELGRMTYDVLHKEKLVRPSENMFVSYDPFHSVTIPKILNFLEGRGIASRLERKAQRYMLGKFSGYHYRETTSPSGLRFGQLEKRGVKPGQRMTLRDHIKLMQKTTRVWSRTKRRL